MITVLSPAKTLDYDSPVSIKKASEPRFLRDAASLARLMKKKSAKDLSGMMNISPKLADLNVERFQNWSSSIQTEEQRQALLAFKGDVYLGLEADSYSARDFNFAQKNLRILSGLYGLLKPLDLIQPYRLEMGIKLKNSKGNDLYKFWNKTIACALTQELAGHRNKTLINLASIEYFKAVDLDFLPNKVITPVFKDYNKGTYKILSFFSKKARGMMATYIVKNRINQPEALKSFDADGYHYSEELSMDNQWVFTRKA
ncbi:MAG: peroxide stress protein YaaA [Gammaproteobacteria bacterium]|jgi:uncharacterized protein|nr:peroxide stress protein YaaA [Gammaproteobacteria bacterium]MBT5205437.1 peroxide stress protein YaaA [Gammaproteobacteria bacterium]MBT5603338.1 peroxide stress protein YaaA [Gammaproteobacteria bacterium]MBT6245463.1 peroxide stress protein YaaA [Gammaproteobacteria bacterium]